MGGLQAYHEVLGHYPATDSESTWFEKLLREDLLRQDSFWLSADGRLPVDEFGREYVYEVPRAATGGSSTASREPVVRSVGRNGIDEGGGGDDWDVRWGPRWGHWYKQDWGDGVGVACFAILVGACGVVLLLRKRHLLPAIALLSAVVFVGSISGAVVADRDVLSTARTLPAWPLHVAGAAFVIAATASLLALAAATRRGIRAGNVVAGRCARCGYDLRTTGSAACPECGEEIERRSGRSMARSRGR